MRNMTLLGPFRKKKYLEHKEKRWYITRECGGTLEGIGDNNGLVLGGQALAMVPLCHGRDNRKRALALSALDRGLGVGRLGISWLGVRGLRIRGLGVGGFGIRRLGVGRLGNRRCRGRRCRGRGAARAIPKRRTRYFEGLRLVRVDVELPKLTIGVIKVFSLGTSRECCASTINHIKLDASDVVLILARGVHRRDLVTEQVLAVLERLGNDNIPFGAFLNHLS
jgi:hypothetical protein